MLTTATDIVYITLEELFVVFLWPPDVIGGHNIFAL